VAPDLPSCPAQHGGRSGGNKPGRRCGKESDRCESSGRSSFCASGAVQRPRRCRTSILAPAVPGWNLPAGAPLASRAGQDGPRTAPFATCSGTLHDVSENEAAAAATRNRQSRNRQAIRRAAAAWHRTCLNARHNMGAVAAGTNRGDATAKGERSARERRSLVFFYPAAPDSTRTAQPRRRSRSGCSQAAEPKELCGGTRALPAAGGDRPCGRLAVRKAGGRSVSCRVHRPARLRLPEGRAAGRRGSQGPRPARRSTSPYRCRRPRRGRCSTS
jgi:hypothetical protein